jgi:hypothetical protein
MATKKRKFLVSIHLQTDVEAEDEASALANASFKIRYGFTDMMNPSVSVVMELPTEAPQADQVTVHEDDGEIQPVPFAPTPQADALEAHPHPVPVTAADDIAF